MTTPTYIRGLPGDLPPGEHILWQGAPAWRAVASRVCFAPAALLYFALVAAITAAALALQGAPLARILFAALPLLGAGLVIAGFLAVLAFWIARSTEYTLTNRRLVFRIGLALCATLAIPHRAIARAGITMHRDGTGNLPIETKPGFKVALHRVWPHARPWRFVQAQPMLLCVPNAGILATLLAQTLQSAEADRLRVPAPTPTRLPTPAREPALAE